jgi:regulator of cell morphogenesis and NO signaling
MSTNLERTVGDLAVAMPGATRIFERLGIDYCCGGTRSLRDACDRAGLAAEEVLKELEGGIEYGSPASDSEWQNCSLAELISHIVFRHHAYLKEEIPRLEKLIAKVAGVHGKKHPEVLRVQAIFQSLHNELMPHMIKEEQVLFPYIEQLEYSVRNHRVAPAAHFGTVRNPIKMMTYEHDQAGDQLREIRTATGSFALPEDACASYRALYEALQESERDLHQHIHLENNILFPKAIQLESNL